MVSFQFYNHHKQSKQTKGCRKDRHGGRKRWFSLTTTSERHMKHNDILHHTKERKKNKTMQTSPVTLLRMDVWKWRKQAVLFGAHGRAPHWQWWPLLDAGTNISVSLVSHTLSGHRFATSMSPLDVTFKVGNWGSSIRRIWNRDRKKKEKSNRYISMVTFPSVCNLSCLVIAAGNNHSRTGSLFWSKLST